MNLKELTQQTITQKEKEIVNLKDFLSKLEKVDLPVATHDGCFLSQGSGGLGFFNITHATRKDFCAFKAAYPKVTWEHGITDPECKLWFKATNMTVDGLPIHFWEIEG